MINEHLGSMDTDTGQGYDMNRDTRHNNSLKHRTRGHGNVTLEYLVYMYK